MKKSIFKRLTAMTLLVFTVISLLVACGPASDGGVTSDESTTEIPETEAPEVFIDIVKDQATEYVIMRADKASDAVISCATRLRDAFDPFLGNSLTGIKIKNDYVNVNMGDTIPETAKEIVVGRTNRPEDAEFAELLNDKDYGIFYRNERIYIFGKTDGAVSDAVDYFIEKYLSGDTVTISDATYEIVKYSYRFDSIKIDGTDLSEYRVVIPENADLLTTYAAENFVSYIREAYGKELTVVTDKEAEQELEILIGKTNRQASARAFTEAADGKYVLYKNGKQIVTAGNGYLVGAGAAALITKHLGTDKAGDINDIPNEPTAATYTFNEVATSAILMIGDGMADNHIDATIKHGLSEFVARQLPNKGYAITHSLNYPSVTDSAASATALSSGYKTWNKYLGMDRNKVSKQNVRELAQSKGAKTAVITTDVITGATPGGFLVHIDNRNSTDAIQSQISKLMSQGLVDYCEGSVGDNFRAKIGEALYGMTDGDDMIFAMFEAALIDKRSHSNDLSGIYEMTERYNDAIAYVIEYILFHPDTALVITADHECGGVTLNNATGQYYFTSGDHTNANVPVFALGGGTSVFNGKTVDNTDIAKFLASVYDPNGSFGE